MDKVLAQLKSEADKYRAFATKHKEHGDMDSCRINLNYAYGVESAISKIERSLPKPAPKYFYTYTSTSVLDVINQHINGVHKLPAFFYKNVLELAQEYGLISVI